MAFSAIRCKGCGKNKYPMEMHKDTQCKNCWLKEYLSKWRNGTTKMVETRRKNKVLLGKN